MFYAKTFAKLLQNTCKTFLQMFYLTCNHGLNLFSAQSPSKLPILISRCQCIEELSTLFSIKLPNG